MVDVKYTILKIKYRQVRNASQSIEHDIKLAYFKYKIGRHVITQ